MNLILWAICTVTHQFVQSHTNLYSHTTICTVTHQFVQSHANLYSHMPICTVTHQFVQSHINLCSHTPIFFQSFPQFFHKQFQVDTCDNLENYTVPLITSYVFDSHLKRFGGADRELTDGHKGLLD
jgi:hypothetical protein